MCPPRARTSPGSPGAPAPPPAPASNGEKRRGASPCGTRGEQAALPVILSLQKLKLLLNPIAGLGNREFKGLRWLVRSLKARNSRSFNRPSRPPAGPPAQPSPSTRRCPLRSPRTRAQSARRPPALPTLVYPEAAARRPNRPEFLSRGGRRRCGAAARAGVAHSDSAPAVAAGREPGSLCTRREQLGGDKIGPGRRRTTIRKWLQLRGTRVGTLTAGPLPPLTGCLVCGYILLRSRIIHAASRGAGGWSSGDQGCRRGGGNGEGRPGPAAPGLAGHRRQQRGAAATAASAARGGRCHIPRGRSAGGADRVSRAPPLHTLRRAVRPVRRRARRAEKASLPTPVWVLLETLAGSLLAFCKLLLLPAALPATRGTVRSAPTGKATAPRGVAAAEVGCDALLCGGLILLLPAGPHLPH